MTPLEILSIHDAKKTIIIDDKMKQLKQMMIQIYRNPVDLESTALPIELRH